MEKSIKWIIIVYIMKIWDTPRVQITYYPLVLKLLVLNFNVNVYMQLSNSKFGWKTNKTREACVCGLWRVCGGDSKQGRDDIRCGIYREWYRGIIRPTILTNTHMYHSITTSVNLMVYFVDSLHYKGPLSQSIKKCSWQPFIIHVFQRKVTKWQQTHCWVINFNILFIAVYW
jgi:hypothetical protein